MATGSQSSIFRGIFNKPAAYDGGTDITDYLNAFDIFLQVMKVADDGEKRDILLSYLTGQVVRVIRLEYDIQTGSFDELCSLLKKRYADVVIEEKRLEVLATKLRQCQDVHDYKTKIVDGLKTYFSDEPVGFRREILETVFLQGLPEEIKKEILLREYEDFNGLAAKRGSCEFVVTVGDNFYYTGVRNEDDPRFYLTFEKVYVAPSLFVPWYIIAGNHDHITNITAQVAYSKKSPRWHFPSLYYSQVFKIPGSSREIHLVMIDTTLLCQTGKHKHLGASQDQLDWVKKELSKSRSDYLLVAGHHPVLSAGVHGSTECLVRKLKPLLEKYAVSVYFSGHDHNLQHIHEPFSKVHYFVSGSGNFFNGWVFNKHRLPRGSLKFFYGHSGGFALVEVSGDKLHLTFINELDKVMYRTMVQPRFGPNSAAQKYGELLRSILKKPFTALTELFSAYGRSKPVNKRTVFGFS